MAEESSTTETTTVKSSGTVKITVEEYNDLMHRANRPQNVTYNRIEKTPEMAANDKVFAGSMCMGGGAALFALGVIQFVAGKKALKAL